MDIQEMISNHTNSIVKGHSSSPDVACQCCHHKPEVFKLHESRKRQFRLIVEDIVKVTVSFLLRWRCISCGTTFTEYPSFAVPHKRFVLSDISKLAQSYIKNDTLSYRDVVKKNGIDIEYPDNNGLCEQFVSHSTVWRFMSYLADRYQEKRQQFIMTKTIPLIPSFKYRSNKRKALLYDAFKEILLSNLQANKVFFPDLKTDST